MNLLAIVQALHRESRLPGTPPSAVTGQTGRAADLVRWAIEAYNDIQRDRQGEWRWLHRAFTLPTVSGTASYAYTAATDVVATAAISRFRAWDIDGRLPPLIYLTADGQSTERELTLLDWPSFRYAYVFGTHTSAYPGTFAVDPANKIHLGPTPDAVYTVRGNYWRSNQALADDSDEPEMPADYHMLIVYRAMLKYGYNEIAPHVLSRAQYEGTALYEALVGNQSYSRYSFSLGGPLA